MNFYSKELPIEVYSTEQTALVQFKLDNGDWQDLKREGNFWWKIKFDISKLLDGRYNLQIKALDKNNQLLCHKTQDIWITNKVKSDIIPYKVEVVTDKDEYKIKEKMGLTITVTDAQGNSISDQTVYYSFFQPIGWEEYKSKKITDKQGKITVQYSSFTSGYITIAAGIVYKDEGYERRFGDIKVVLVK